MDNPSSSSPSSPLPTPPNPPLAQPSPSSSPTPTPTATTTPPSNPPSPDVKPKLDLIPTSNPTPNSNPTPAFSPPKKTPPLPWTHQETVTLIQAYQEKWYSLKKGQLKASQWEEVSITVAARCGYDVPSKSATQCRHKIEKLRKRYRAERLKPFANVWQYFELMDRMERGPLPIAAHPPVTAAPVNYPGHSNSVGVGVGAGNYNESDSDEGDVNYGGAEMKKNKLKSINNIVRGDVGMSSNSSRNVNRMGMNRNYGVNESGRATLRGLSTPMNLKRKGYFQNDESNEEEEEEEEEDEEGLEEDDDMEEEKEGILGSELAAEIRGFAERFMRMENKKIEMMRETERYRIELEKKRMDMILEAQRKVVDTIGRAFGAHKKVKMAQEI